MRIAIIRLSAFGDVVIASSMLAGLKALGDYRIEWFVDERFSGILEHSPCITKIHSLPFKKLLKSIGGLLEIRRYCKSCGEFDMVVDMQGLIKSAIVGKCLVSKKFVGFSKDGAREGFASYFYTHKVSIPYDSNILERNFSVLFSHIKEFQTSPFTLERVMPLHSQGLGFSYHFITESLTSHFSALNHMEEKPYTFLFILEASIKEKMYPIEKYAKLAQLLQGLLQNCHFHILWNEDKDRADSMLTLLKKQGLKATQLDKLDFNSLKFVLRQVDCAIGGDTGVTHLAWAMGTHCITLYGNNTESSGKNMRDTKLSRVLLGNPYVVSKGTNFEIESIEPREIFEVFKHNVLESLGALESLQE